MKAGRREIDYVQSAGRERERGRPGPEVDSQLAAGWMDAGGRANWAADDGGKK